MLYKNSGDVTSRDRECSCSSDSAVSFKFKFRFESQLPVVPNSRASPTLHYVCQFRPATSVAKTLSHGVPKWVGSIDISSPPVEIS